MSEYKLERLGESTGKHGIIYVQYMASIVHDDGNYQYLGHVFIPADKEKLILSDTAANAPRMKLQITYGGDECE